MIPMCKSVPSLCDLFLYADEGKKVRGRDGTGEKVDVEECEEGKDVEVEESED